MFFIAVFLLLLFIIAAAFAWLAENPGSVTVQWDWLNNAEAYEVTLLQAVLAIGVVVALLMMAWWVISGILGSPKSFGRWRSGRRRDKGYAALSRGLVAAGAGNAPLARKLSKESDRLLENEPLVAMLDAQTALLEGNRGGARVKFESMLQNDETRLLGLRGLYVEAEQEGVAEAAAHFAKEANDHTPGTPWAAEAVLKSQAIGGEWEEALKTLELNRASGLYDKEEYKRKRAVILTAHAMEEEASDPEKAKSHALAAHKLAPSLVPAAVLAAQVSARLNDMRKAAKVLEASWKLEPHPEIAETYIHLRSGDSAHDRLKRAENLAQKRAHHTEGQFIVAQAAIDAGEFKIARDAMETTLKIKPTERACLLMADIEEAEHGDKGRVREWLARAVVAPKDATWTADGVVSDQWAPYSPVTGRLDAFEWKVPVEQLGGPGETVDYSQLANEPLEEEFDEAVIETIEGEVETINTKPNDEEGDNSKEAKRKDKGTENHDSLKKAGVAATVASIAATAANSAEDAEIIANDDSKNKSKGNSTEEDLSPYKNSDHDTNSDGQIDHRPDDPGIGKKKKGKFF